MNLSSVKVAGIAIVLLVAGIAAGFGLGFGFFQPKISDLENQNSQQQVQISDLQNQISTLLTNITELEERVRDLEFLLGDVHVYPRHSIQEAIDLAQFGDTIFVHSGTYYENVVVNKSISLIGENKDTTIIDGGAKGDVVQVNVNNTVVSGFTIQNSAHELWGNGISIMYSFNCSVFDNIIRNNMWGIGLFGCIDCSVYGNIIGNEWGVVGWAVYPWRVESRVSSNCSVYDNIFVSNGIDLDNCSNWFIYGNTETGNGTFLRIKDSSNIFIHENNASNGYHDIILDNSSHCTLRNNNMTNNRWSLAVCGSSLQTFIHDVDDSNTINGKRVCYIVNQNNLTINSLTYPDTGYVAIVNSTFITVEDLTLASTFQGVLMAYVANSTIKNITATNNYYGIKAFHSSNFSVFDSTLSDNIQGILIDNCSNGSLWANTATDNKFHLEYLPVACASAEPGAGFHVRSSFNCSVYNNDLIGNDYGILLTEASECHIYGNNVSNNEAGIGFEQSNNNEIYHNNFINNEYQIHDAHWWYPYLHSPSTNIWDYGYPSGGNYWSDYNGTDLYSGQYQNTTGSDGIGDTPYVIDENNQDNYPIVPELPSFTNSTTAYDSNTTSSHSLQKKTFYVALDYLLNKQSKTS